MVGTDWNFWLRIWRCSPGEELEDADGSILEKHKRWHLGDLGEVLHIPCPCPTQTKPLSLSKPRLGNKGNKNTAAQSLEIRTVMGPSPEIIWNNQLKNSCIFDEELQALFPAWLFANSVQTERKTKQEWDFPQLFLLSEGNRRWNVYDVPQINISLAKLWHVRTFYEGVKSMENTWKNNIPEPRHLWVWADGQWGMNPQRGTHKTWPANKESRAGMNQLPVGSLLLKQMIFVFYEVNLSYNSRVRWFLSSGLNFICFNYLNGHTMVRARGKASQIQVFPWTRMRSVMPGKGQGTTAINKMWGF